MKKEDLFVITEVSEMDHREEPIQSPDRILTSSSELPVVSESTISSVSANSRRSRWQRAKAKIKGQRAFKSIDEEILLYGTTNELTDQQNRYKQNINQLITVKTELKDRFRSIGTADTLELQRHKCLLSPGNWFKRVWNPVVSLALLFTATVMPYRIAFSDEVFWDAWVVIELVIDGLFIFDIGITFISVEVRDDGTYEANTSVIARNYLKGWFLIDVLSSLPFTLMDYFLQADNQNVSSGKYNNAMKLARLPRLYKLLRVVRVLKAFRHYQQNSVFTNLQDLLQINSRSFKLVKFLIYVMVAVHLMACLWYFSSRLQDFDNGTWVSRYGYTNKPNLENYLAAVYFSITTLVTVGYGDIVPVSQTEQIVAIAWMIVGVGFYSYTVGSISSFLSSIDTQESALALKLAAVQELAKETGLSYAVKNKVRTAISYNTYITGSVWSDKHSLFSELPKSLRFEVASTMYSGVLKEIHFFRNKDQALINFAMPLLKPLRFVEAQYLYQEGEYADEVFFITFGRVNLMIKRYDIVYKSYIKGSYVGEIEVMRGVPRLTNCACRSHTEVMTLSKSDFLLLLEEFPNEKKNLQQVAVVRLRKEKQTYVNLMELMRLKAQRGNLEGLAGKEQLFQLDPMEVVSWETDEERRGREVLELRTETRELPELISSLQSAVSALEAVVQAVSNEAGNPSQY